MTSVKAQYSSEAWERHKARERARHRTELKRCSRCGVEKPRAEFSRDTRERLSVQAWCKGCAAEYRKEWRLRWSPEERYARYRASHLKKFGLTVERYDELLRSQNGVCAICGSDTPFTPKNGAFIVDHDHETGEVRGLLCSRCNRGIGYLGDDPQRLTRALDYLLGWGK